MIKLQRSIENALFNPQIFTVRLPAYFGAQLMLNVHNFGSNRDFLILKKAN